MKIMADYKFGDIDGVVEGAEFADRAALRAAGIHLALVAGIDGNRNDGCPSIVLNGGYVDDSDFGDEIIYTGHGGNNPGSKKQIKDQSWNDSRNTALIVSEMHGYPVRVTRGYKHKSPYSPKTGYRYDGLYMLAEHFPDKGKDGFGICRYRLLKISSLVSNTESAENSQNDNYKTPIRVPTTILRIVRDTKISKQVKSLYDYTCQICGLRIDFNGVGYAEAAHIRPLGQPHNGHDKLDNVLCLCPNHHVMFDKGHFTIDLDLSFVGYEGRLRLHKDHKINIDNIRYHYNNYYKGV
jgi:putative restriction endonuclease